MSKQQLSEHDKAFYRDGYRLGSSINNTKSEGPLFGAISTLYQSIDELIDSLLLLAQREGIAVDCKKGCSYCCHQAVFANSYEVHYLGSFLKTHFSKDELQQLIDNAKAKNDSVEALSDQEMLNAKFPCPLLKDGICQAYQARPMACRIYLSQKLSSCIEFYNNPNNQDNYPALLNFPLRAGRMMNEGFTAALKGNNILTTEFRLEEGLLAYFTQNQG